MDINLVVVSGRATKDPVVNVKNENNKTVKTARWNMAVKKIFKRNEEESDAHFLKFVAYNKVAERVEKFIHKGSKFTVVSHIDTYSYTKDGVQIPVVEFVVDNIYLSDVKFDEVLPVDEEGFTPMDAELEAEAEKLFG